MLTFENDYAHGCHPLILQRLIETNAEPLPGYGFDRYSSAAAEKIRAACAQDDAAVYFLSGGTQTNMVMLDALLPSWAAVICCDSGHIETHESGALEFTGHKVVTLPSHDGKLDADELDAYFRFLNEHNALAQIARPAAVYISFPTEIGTLYRKSELAQLRAVCDRHKLLLFCDGARLGYGLASPSCDLTLPELAALCDAFYIGGTKLGALCGEAAVFRRSCASQQFYATMKQHGAMLAKGRLCGVQFDALFTDGLYMKLAGTAIEMARRLRDCLLRHGFSISPADVTNQVFVSLPHETYLKLNERVRVCYWETASDGSDLVRFCTSSATTEADIRSLDQVLSVL